jgi:hypothetical protein
MPHFQRSLPETCRVSARNFAPVILCSSPSGFSTWHVLCSILIHSVPHKRSSGPGPEVP